MDPLELAKYFSGGAGVAIAFPIAKAVVQIVRKWGEKEDLLKATAKAVDNLAEKVEAHTEKTGASLGQITERTTRLEYILTGDRGENGVRGQVAKVEATTRDINDKVTDLRSWRERVDDELKARVQRPRTRRKRSA